MPSDPILAENAYWAKRGCAPQGWAGESDAAKWCKKRERQLLQNGSHDVGATSGSHIPEAKKPARSKASAPVAKRSKKNVDNGAETLRLFERCEDLETDNNALRVEIKSIKSQLRASRQLQSA